MQSEYSDLGATCPHCSLSGCSIEISDQHSCFSLSTAIEVPEDSPVSLVASYLVALIRFRWNFLGI